MNRERELLERLLENFERPVTGRFGDLFDEVRTYLAEPTQDEPVDTSYKSGPTIVAMLPNGVAVWNVYEAYEAGLKERSLQDEEPIAWWNGITPEMSEEEFWIARCIHYGIASHKTDDCDIPLYLHPAPRPEFVRLSEEEVNSLTYAPYEPYELICAVENRLVEKNK